MDAPRSDAAEVHVEKFLADVRRRYRGGKTTYGDVSFERPIEELIKEIEEELVDVAGWSAILYARLEEARELLSRISREAHG